MCDTLGRIVSSDFALFAKNSDRSPNEPQVLEYRPATDQTGSLLRTTYLTIEQVPHTNATLISRPAWMWGAEMGVNEHGVCIGNEAVFTRGRYASTGLTGMDLVRLGLERANSAKRAVEVILTLLERHGQGGNCGYDHSFFYDNAFLILDRQEIYILETAGSHWVYKRVSAGSISNRLSIRDEGDTYSGGKAFDFAARYREPVYSHFSGSHDRLSQTAYRLPDVKSAADMTAALRVHRQGKEPLLQGDVASTCMHAGGLVGDHTTSSLVIELGREITVWATGSSTPCISLFKPWIFGSEPCAPVFSAEHPEISTAYWLERENFARRAVGHRLPEEFYRERDLLEQSWMLEEPTPARSVRARAQEAAFYEKWRDADLGPSAGSGRYQRYWNRKNAALRTPARPVISGE